ncbi:hypothetical protein GH714_039955 [Hevea brasiliensis]|uniref:PTBP1-like RNA recognition motif 2 domain-containing protein n=1 Tax=Hevea brasiliensis TaxID=3981 RepID=A0A6A6MNW5_HEVBR|nr:hypothetical protein GH714_039955 [Hevea brasiliensis]
MVKLASCAREQNVRTKAESNRAEYINAGLYLFATIVLIGGFAAEFSMEPRSGLVLVFIALALIMFVNLHDLVAHLAGIDYRLPLMGYDPQLALVEFAVPVVQALGALLLFLGIFFLFLQEEKGYGYFKLDKHALNMLIAGPALWPRAGWVGPSWGTTIGKNHGMDGHLWEHFAVYWGINECGKVFKMQQIDGLRLEKLRGGAQESLMQQREGQLPLIADEQWRRQRADLNQAIAMISYYASSSEPAQVFSAFGFVHKITTFEKTAGFQALVQFSDAETASSAKNALDGRNIPSYLLPEHIGPCTLRITYSAHTDLSVKFQSHRSRDYTNPNLPVAPSAIDGGGLFSVGLDGKKLEPESNVLLASIENMQYAVTLDVLHMVFSAFGPVQKIAMFDKNGGLQALIQYPDVQTAVLAKEALEGHCIYDGGFCKLHISYSRHHDLSIKVNNDRSRDYTIPNTAMLNPQPSILGHQPVSTIGPPAHPYSGTQFAPPTEHPAMPQPSAGWAAGVLAAPHSMLAQMSNQPYLPPGAMPPQMGPGMMSMAGPSRLPQGAAMPPPYRPGQMQ